MAQTSPAQTSPSEVANKRPRGILKNSASYQHSSPDARISPTAAEHPRPSPSAAIGATNGDAAARPGMPHRELSERELTQMNTSINAGAHRRTSSNARGSLSRRQSGQVGSADDETSPRLKWDEANLYLNEGQMGGKMKIDEPKTPYAGHYDPDEDANDINALNAQELAVDELDMAQSRKAAKEEDIPGLDIGEPEMDASGGGDKAVADEGEGEGEKRVIVDGDAMDVDGARHGEASAEMTCEEREKHRKFELLRKKHYEMKNVKGLLGHAEELDALDDERDVAR